MWVRYDDNRVRRRLVIRTVSLLDNNTLGPTFHLDQNNNPDVTRWLIRRRIVEPPILIFIEQRFGVSSLDDQGGKMIASLARWIGPDTTIPFLLSRASALARCRASRDAVIFQAHLDNDTLDPLE